jgi:hypothetical protein
MAKKQKVPKRVAGVKLPKALRKSGLAKSLLGTAVGRQLLADALIAAAGAAAAVLVKDKGAEVKKGGRAVARANAGLVLAEIELQHPDEQFALPGWVGREVTHDRRYGNSALSIAPIPTREAERSAA